MTARKEYSYGSQEHIDLAIIAMQSLLTRELFGRCGATERCNAIAAEAFCMAEAMLKQIDSL